MFFLIWSLSDLLLKKYFWFVIKNCKKLISKARDPSNLVSTITRERTQNWFLHCKMRSFSSKLLICYLIDGVFYWFHKCWTLFWELKLVLSWWTKRTPFSVMTVAEFLMESDEIQYIFAPQETSSKDFLISCNWIWLWAIKNGAHFY